MTRRAKRKRERDNRSSIDCPSIDSLPIDLLQLIGTYQAIQARYILIIWNWFDREIACCKMFSTREKAEQYCVKWLNKKLDESVKSIEEFREIERTLDRLDVLRYMQCRIIESK